MCDVHKVWAAFLADEEFTEAMPEGPARVLFRRFYVAESCAVLRPHLGKKVSMKSVFESRLALAKFVLDARLTEKILPYLPPDEGEERDLPKAIESAEKFATQAVANFEQALKDLETAFRDGVTGEMLLAYGGVNALTVDVSKMTIQELVEQYPTTLFI